MARTLRKEAFYSHPPQKVWVALTDPRAIAEWLMPNNFKPEVGHEFRFEVDPMPGCGCKTFCRVTEVDPPRRLAYTWHPVDKRGDPLPGRPSLVTWTLTPDRGGTRLVLEHSGLDIFPWWQRLMLRMGWGTMVRRWIGRVAANVDEQGGFTPGAIPLERRCYKCAGVPAELVR